MPGYRDKINRNRNQRPRLENRIPTRSFAMFARNRTRKNHGFHSEKQHKISRNRPSIRVRRITDLQRHHEIRSKTP